MLERDLALLADPRGRRGELLEVGDGLDRALLDRGAVLREVVVELEVVRGDVEDLLQRLVELGLLRVDVGADLGAKRLLGVGDAGLLRVEVGPVFVEDLPELAVLRLFAEGEDALHLGEERVVVEDGEVVEARLRALAVGVLEGEVVGDLQVLAVALQRVAGVDGEEAPADEPLVLAALADAVAVGRDEEERLVFSEALHPEVRVGALGLHDAAVLEHAGLEVLVAVGELGGEHDLRVAVGIRAADDLELLRGDARDAREVVGEGLGDGARGDGVGRLARGEAVDRADDRAARREDALGAHEGAGVRRVALRELLAFVVVQLDDGALGEVPEDGREPVVVVPRADVHHRVADLREEALLGLLEERLVRGPGGELPEVDVRELPLERPHQLPEDVARGDAAVAGEKVLRGVLQRELRHGGHARRMRAPGEHDLLADRLALALRGEGGVLGLERVELGEARLGADVGHQAARVVRRPVVAVDEAGFDAVRLELVEEDGVGAGAVDAHALAETSPLHEIGDRGLSFGEGLAEVPQPGRLGRLRLLLELLPGAELVRLQTAPFQLQLRDRRVDGPLGGGGDLLLRLERRKVDALRDAFGDLPADLETVLLRELEHLRRRVELAVRLGDETVLADGRQAGERRLHVAGAQRLVQLGALAQHGIEGVAPEDAVFLLERGLERLHRGVVGLGALGKDEVPEPGRGRLALALHRDVAGGEERGVRKRAEGVEGGRERHGGGPFAGSTRKRREGYTVGGF